MPPNARNLDAIGCLAPCHSSWFLVLGSWIQTFRMHAHCYMIDAARLTPECTCRACVSLKIPSLLTPGMLPVRAER
ncbi:hypothetical protein B0H17DRAFT_708331 [Mycena rosella]|uniref:Uncharacterized protein n=1 Tax=Mycena rosella TaxID=1033263 RepID=A0AAD7DA85_MYCRO|nr:hypothetical protein B0H17DRAFT_708331 [Mycena rosella]